MEFSPEQQAVFDAYLAGKNIFMTGPGGTGKSHLIRSIYKNAIFMGKQVQVCAFTGCAAILLNCHAKTVNSWAGIGLGTGTPESILEKIKKYRKTKQWLSTSLLIVDEVSMVSLKLFELLNYIGKKLRKNDKAFGGIQVIFSGDFFQLPPIPDRIDDDTGRFCFESPHWSSVFDVQIELKTNFRQKDDSIVRVLNQIRVGKLSKSGYELLKSRVGIDASGCLVKPIKLFPRKYMVDDINSSEMSKINEPDQTYHVTVVKEQLDPKITQDMLDNEEAYLRKNALFDEIVKLKVGAQVMCIANINMDIGICNGSVGIITKFVPANTHDKVYPFVKFNNGVEMIMARHCWMSETIEGFGVSQVPLILAWAITIHKSQGATLDLMEIDVGKEVFECGQTYVGLSRVRDLSGLFITSFDPQKIKVNSKVQRFYAVM